MFSSLLLPVDGSKFAEHALPIALSIARRAGARIQLVHVHAPLTENPKAYGFSIPPLDAHLKEEHQTYLESLRERIRKVSTVPVTSSFLEGEIAETLRVTASSTDTDLVVMTTHGRGLLQRFWVGSVADALVRQLSVPLLLVRPREEVVDFTREPAVKRIILPLDGSALSEQILPPALGLGSLMDAEITLLRVIKPVYVPPASDVLAGGPYRQQLERLMQELKKGEEELRQKATEYLERMAEKVRAASLRVKALVVTSEHAAQAILEQASNTGSDVIAMETHGRRGLSRIVLGSVADKVLRGAVVPMLVHRPVYQ
jgi:nucleotide-binding universal stress UspA family protein